jgi:hypothetical protein
MNVLDEIKEDVPMTEQVNNWNSWG